MNAQPGWLESHLILAEAILRLRAHETSQLHQVILDEAFQIGRKLIFARAKMPELAFREWARDEFEMEPELARRYMELARKVAISRDSVLPASLPSEIRAGNIPLRGDE